MNFLELVLRTRRECSGTGSAPLTVVGQTGMNARFVDWVSDAWTEIQSSQENWTWMRKEFSFPVGVGDADYTPAEANVTSFSRWHIDTFRLYLSSRGVEDEQYLSWCDWADFRDTYRFGLRQSNRPSAFGIRPHDDAILFDTTPEAAYTCVGEYQESPATLAADVDTPAVEARFHMLIVYHAMVKYGIDQVAPEVISRGQVGINKLMPDFERRYLPRMI